MSDNRKIIIIGAGVSSIFLTLQLLEKGYNGKNIHIIEKGKDPYNREETEVMSGFFGAGGFSDGKVVFSLSRGGDLISYTGKEQALKLINQLKYLINKFHPHPEKLKIEFPKEPPKFIIDSNFDLLQSELYHIGTNYLLEMSKNIFNYFQSKNVNMYFKTEVLDMYLNHDRIEVLNSKGYTEFLYYDELVIAIGKSGSTLIKNLTNKYQLQTSPRNAQIGVRFESDMKYFKNIIDVQYDFKLSKDYEQGVNVRTFCVNNKAAYVSQEIQDDRASYNGHAYIQENKINNLTNFGIIMDVPLYGDDPYEVTNNVVKKSEEILRQYNNKSVLVYNPKNRVLSLPIKDKNQILNITPDNIVNTLKYIFGDSLTHILGDFIHNLDKIFKFGEDFVLYIPEIKYLSNTINVNHSNLSLKIPQYYNVHLMGDCLSARGIFVSAAQGIYLADNLV